MLHFRTSFPTPLCLIDTFSPSCADASIQRASSFIYRRALSFFFSPPASCNHGGSHETVQRTLSFGNVPGLSRRKTCRRRRWNTLSSQWFGPYHCSCICDASTHMHLPKHAVTPSHLVFSDSALWFSMHYPKPEEICSDSKTKAHIPFRLCWVFYGPLHGLVGASPLSHWDSSCKKDTSM